MNTRRLAGGLSVALTESRRRGANLTWAQAEAQFEGSSACWDRDMPHEWMVGGVMGLRRTSSGVLLAVTGSVSQGGVRVGRWCGAWWTFGDAW